VTEKRTLIIAKTATEARDHALAYDLKHWHFVASAQDLAGAEPATHTLEFAGAWYERADLKPLRRQIRGRGFNVPHLTQIPRMRTRMLSQGMPSDDVDDDT
jgi:hypothetical protein